MLAFGQKKEVKQRSKLELLKQSLMATDWKLANGIDSMRYAFSSINHHNYTLTDDSTITVDECYLHFAYKISMINADSLILKPISFIYKPIIKRELKELIFVKDSINVGTSEFNILRNLSFNSEEYDLIIDDSLGIKTTLFNGLHKEIILSEKSQIGLDNFILNNRFNDTHVELFICETKYGYFGVVSASEHMEVAPIFTSIKIQHEKSERIGNRLYSTPIVCVDYQGNQSEHIYYY